MKKEKDKRKKRKEMGQKPYRAMTPELPAVDAEAKQALLRLLHDPKYQPMKIKELAILLGVSKEDRPRLEAVLDVLVAEGSVEISKRGKYHRAGLLQEETEERKVITGIFCGTQKGFGFVRVEGQDDIYIDKKHVGTAMHGDTVCVELFDCPSRKGRSAEGTVVNVLERSMSHVVGTFMKSKKYGFVLPDQTKLDKDIFVEAGKEHGAVDGHKVVVKLLNYGAPGKNPEGEVVEILGHKNDPGVDILSIVRAHDLPVEFSEEIYEQLKQVPTCVSSEEAAKRRDLRDWQTVTIDGEDAKDLDDAITLTENEKGYVLGVHIADVTHYVRENSPIDQEAKRRGTSVYLLDRVIPMLPHLLSNGICSLNAGEDRLALSCIMQLDFQGNVTDSEICESVIRVDRRMSYPVVAQLLQEENIPKELLAQYHSFMPFFQRMLRVSKLIRKNRQERGALSFDFPEAKIKLNEKGFPIEIAPYERNCATDLIEDFMLMANETVAQEFYWRGIPFLYRNHEKPDEEKMRQFAIFLGSFGKTLHVQNQEIHPKKLQQVTEWVVGRPEEALVNRVLLRSMKQARYSPESLGHFGLAARFYTHFTSPIRRYPDLQIHRIIKEVLSEGLSENREVHYRELLPAVADQASRTERRAEEAEREVIKRKKAQYMKKQVGKSFEGIVSGITAWGMFVELPNTVEGCVHVADMTDDYYVYDEARYRLVGEAKRKTYTLGQSVRVLVDSVDVDLSAVNFVLESSRLA